ncbi:MAG: AAA family ATPase [Spiroplasma ixodetis]|nr:AAA family ATPase [Spiroplasma ixodetis]MBP1526870.1 AAA family ATPase [Spiroplasma ixodetis]MBP1528451.1 AAA family ATPase [Spiroplasma ixodetis]
MKIYDIIFNDVNINDVILKIPLLNKKLNEIDILPSNSKMSFFDVEIINRAFKENNKNIIFNNLLLLIEKIKNNYDYILIDSPPSTGLIMSNVLCAVDDIFIPIQPEAYSYQGFSNLISYINEIKQEYKLKIKVSGLIPTLVNKRTNLHKIMVEAITDKSKYHNIKILSSIPLSIKQADSIASHNLPLILSNINHQHSNIYVSLLKEMNLN